MNAIGNNSYKNMCIKIRTAKHIKPRLIDLK